MTNLILVLEEVVVVYNDLIEKNFNENSIPFVTNGRGNGLFYLNVIIRISI